MRLNKRGVALLQVLIISALLAGLSTMILRATLSRTVMARQTRRTVSAQMLIESCMAQVSDLWASKTPEAYARDLKYCVMECLETNEADCDNNSKRIHTCTLAPFGLAGGRYTVEAKFTTTRSDSSGRCELQYTIVDGVTKL